MISNDRDGSPDIYHFDYDIVNNQATNGIKVTQISQDYRSEEYMDISDDGSLMIYGVSQGGADVDIFQVNLPGFTNAIKITGLNTSYGENAPFFFGSEDKIAFSTDRPGSAYQGSNVFVASNYNRTTHSVGAIAPLDALNSNLNDGSGDTDSNGETCISVETAPSDGGPHQWVIKCDPNVPGPSTPDAGTGGTGGSGGSGIDAGGSAGTGGAGGSAGTGGSGVDSGTGGAGGIDAGGTGGSSPDAGTGGAGGAGGIDAGGSVGTGGTETGGAAGSGPDAGGAGGSGIDAGGTGGTETGGSAGSGIDAGGTGGTETGGSAGSGVDAGEEDGSAPDCRIKVTTNSGDCEVVDCGNYAVGGVVTLHTVNGDCYYIDPLQNVLHITGTGDSYIQQYNLALAQTVGVEVTHPSGNPKITFGYQTDNGSNMNAGTLGTIVDSKVENRNGEKGVYFHVSKDAVDTTICNSNKECTGVSTFDYGAGPGIVTEGKNIWMSFKDIDQIADSIVQQPDAGQIITPPAESKDGGGCSLCSASPKDISHDINGWIGLVLVGGAMAYRRSRRA
jgi:hypothetical protein